MTDNPQVNAGSGVPVEGIDEGSGIIRQVFCLGSVGKSGQETQLRGGASLSANSFPVVLPTDPDSRPASGNITLTDSASTTVAGQDGIAIITGVPTAGSFQSYPVNGRGAARIQVSGTWVGTLAFEGSIDGGSTWYPQPARVSGSAISRYQVTANGLYDLAIVGLTHYRVRAILMSSGTATVQPTSSSLDIIAHPGGLAVIGSRPIPTVKGTLAYGTTSYVATRSIGALLTIPTGLLAGSIITNLILRYKTTQANISAAGTQLVSVFDANPAASTYTDNVAEALNAADIAKAIAQQATSISSSVGGPAIFTAAFTGRFPVDATGNIYAALIALTTTTFVGTGNLNYEMNGTY